MVCVFVYLSLDVTYWETFHKFDSLIRWASCTSNARAFASHIRASQSARTCSKTTAFCTRLSERAQVFEWRESNENETSAAALARNKRSQHPTNARETTPFRHKFAWAWSRECERENYTIHEHADVIWRRATLCVSAHCASGLSGFRKWYRHVDWAGRCVAGHEFGLHVKHEENNMIRICMKNKRITWIFVAWFLR